MSRMAIPTMDVVRFKEEDVIVASSLHRSLTVSGLHDSTLGNVSMVNEHGEVHSLADFLTYLKFFGGTTNVFFKYDGKGKVNCADIADLEDKDTLSLIDGTYEYSEDGTDIVYYKQ